MTETGRLRSSTAGLPQTPATSPTASVLRLGSDDVDVQSTAAHIGVPRHDGGSVSQGRQTEVGGARSLRDRTVPRWQRRGGLGGAVVAGAAGGVGLGLGGKIGAAIGGLIGLSFAGAGAIPGAIVGAAIGAAIGAGIARLAAGGATRQRAERVIIALQNEGRISQQEAGQLKGISNSELKALVSISQRGSGIQSRAARDEIRKAVLLTAAKQGVAAARLLKAQLLNLKPPGPGEELEESLAETGAQNRLALQPHLTASNDPRFAAVAQNPTRLDEYQRFMADAVAAKSRNGTLVDDQQLRALSRQALDHLDRFATVQDLDDYRARRQDFDDRIAELLRDVAGDASPQQLVARLKAVDQAYGAMAAAENLGAHGTAEMEPRYDAAFMRAAARLGVSGQTVRTTLAKALAGNGALRAVTGAAEQAFENAATAAESEAALGIKGAAVRVVRMLGLIGGPAGNSVQEDELALGDQRPVPPSRQQQANQAVDREVLRSYVDGATVGNVLDRAGHDWLAGRFAHWATNVRLAGEGVEAYHAITDLLGKTDNDFNDAFARFAQEVSDTNTYNISNSDMNKLNHAITNNLPENERKDLLRDIRTHFKNLYDDHTVLDAFKDWLKEAEGLDRG